MRKLIVAGFTSLLVLSCAQAPSPEQQAKDLISKMTLEEKASLMMHPSAPIEALGIPAYDWWNEALHGVARNGKATVFPMPIAMAASFDEPLVNEVFTAVSDEARVKNRWAVESGHVGQYQGLTFWTPNINIFRDPRWGRGMETYGEDPYLTGQLGMAVVRGLQGPSDAAIRKAHACAKHFAVHSGPEWNRHSYNAVVSERDLRETYLPAFKDLVTKADVQEVMIAYNAFRGVPCGANDYLINTVLRGEWGYKGIVLSDCWAIHNFYEPGRHGYSEDVEHAVASAIHTGTDLNCGNSYAHIPEAVQQGLLDEADVDRSLVRLISERIRLGEMVHNTAPWDYLSDDIVEGPEHRALSRKMAEETIVLLQNKGNILPLQAGAKVALVGPNANDREMMWGNYNPIPEQTITLLDGLKAHVPDLVTVKGCGIVGEKEDIKTVLKQLEGKDIVIFAGGISPNYEGEEMDVDAPGFRGGDRTSIELPAVQRELLKALHDAGKKVVLVNFSGSAMGLVPETETCDAIVQAWYPGEEGGAVLADVLYGQVVPSGKLPVTFYKNVDQLPDFEDYNMKGRTYRYFEGEPLYPFGYGLSYTNFAYGEAKIEGNKIVIDINNNGSCTGTEVVQLYVRKVDDAEGPIKTLRGFQRVTILAGQSAEVVFPLTEETFLSWNEEKQNMVPAKGKWELLYGGNSHDVKKIDYDFK
ncbi:MAG: glycoside hydrolase family 3 C-terminal domain-containing protein [Bacteroidales bacterium]|nr:glycoside hydrolase family 3 C-terminal domain-containing protein [Bacteroidales bacterium]